MPTWDFVNRQRYADFLNVMAYDYHGQWDKETGHVAPMYLSPEDKEDNKKNKLNVVSR